MTKPRDPDALLSAYLAGGMEVLPDRVIDAVLDEVHGTRQRTVLGPWRTRSMFKPSLAATAVVVVLFSGALLLNRPEQPAIGDPSPTPSTDPTPSGPSAEPTPSAVTSPAGVWIATGSMGTPRYGHTAVRLLDGRVLVAGGSSSPEADLTSAELYDPGSGTWSATGNMLKPHAGFPATLLRDGKVLVGVDDGAEVYDPESGTWTATGEMVWGGGATATLLRDGTVLVRGDNGSELYDPDSGTWTATRSRATQRHSHAAILLPDGRVLMAGGHVGGDTPTESAELYDPDTGSWTTIASMHAEREAIEAFMQPGGKVLVMGGSDRGAPQSVELYDPATGSWTTTGDVSRPGISVNPSATLLSDGKVLARLRGSTGVDLYDPGTGSWTAIAPMFREHGTPAILLLDGMVLVAGGSDCRTGSSSCPTGATGSAELYVPAGVSPLAALPTAAPPTPVPTPIPTPYPPQAGFVPSGARTWTVRAVNKSSEPATLFVAEQDETGLGRPCGNVTPSVVPAGVTLEVTFLLPPKRVKTCWIWVSPVPGEGGSLFQTSDAPPEGEIHIMAKGQGGWLSP
jgi:Kelch motif